MKTLENLTRQQISELTAKEYMSLVGKAKRKPFSDFGLFNQQCLGSQFRTKNNERIYKDELFRIGCRDLEDIENLGFIIEKRPEEFYLPASNINRIKHKTNGNKRN